MNRNPPPTTAHDYAWQLTSLLTAYRYGQLDYVRWAIGTLRLLCQARRALPLCEQCGLYLALNPPGRN